MVVKRLAEARAEQPPVLDEIQNRAVGVRLARDHRGNCGAPRRGDLCRYAGPAIVLDRRLEAGKLLPEGAIAKCRDVRGRLRPTEREQRLFCKRIGLLDWMIHQVAS